MILNFGEAGNGPEVLWAGIFTLVAVIGSVLLALWSQRRDFDRRELEMRSTFEAQQGVEWSNWRRHIAERCMALISKGAKLSAGHHIHEPDRFDLHQELDELCTLLHLDRDNGGPILGDWISSQIGAMMRSDPRSPTRYHDLHGMASKARARVMSWSLDPSSVLTDSEMMANARGSHANAEQNHQG